MSVAWVDASAGASGDMLLGALVGAGVPIEVLQAAVDAVAPEPIALRVETVDRNGLAATRCHVEISESHHHRSFADIRALLEAAPVATQVLQVALRVFERLAIAEGTVHGHPPDEVEFHEVGALDSIADVVGVCAGFVHLAAEQVVVTPIAVGSGAVRGAHGTLPVPPPAVAELLRGVPSYAGPPDQEPLGELCTPTGAALLVTLATSYGAQPAMSTTEIGVGAGGRDPDGRANVLRLLVGTTSPDQPAPDDLLVLETNVDDLDPRVWPSVLGAMLDAGARDAWLTPILMKKGRPAHTLSVLVDPPLAAATRDVMFRQTSTIGIRSHAVARHVLPRETAAVEVDGQPISVKLARLDGEVLTAQPEYDDMARAAAALGRPVRDVLQEAVAAATRLRSDLGSRPQPGQTNRGSDTA